eukprot:1150964-Pelagomonas_calceolata.AAC.14
MTSTSSLIGQQSFQLPSLQILPLSTPYPRSLPPSTSSLTAQKAGSISSTTSGLSLKVLIVYRQAASLSMASIGGFFHGVAHSFKASSISPIISVFSSKHTMC